MLCCYFNLKMDIKSLAPSVTSQLRSGFKINSFKQCVIELVLNSIDAKSSAIAIRINLASFRIQVVDNGCGISQVNMNLVATRYATSKCRSLRELEKRPKCYGFRGEALASIVSCSKKIVIESRVNENGNTYSKTFENGKWGPVEVGRFRPCIGTTITIENFLYNMPVRKEQIKRNLDMEEIRLYIESLSFVHPSISFSIRDDINNKIILQSHMVETVAEVVVNAYQHINIENFEQLQVTKDKIRVTGLIYKYPYSINKLQLIYVNKRPVECQSIQKVVRKLFLKSFFHQRCVQVFENDANYAVYLLNISCPTSEVEIWLEHSETLVEFKRWDVVLKCIEKLIIKFLVGEELLPKSKTDKTKDEIRNESLGKMSSGVNLSNIDGIFKSVPAKRKRNETYKSKKDVVVKKRKSCPDLETIQQGTNTISNDVDISHDNRWSESEIAPATKENKKSLFDRHHNTQSLVLNSDSDDEPELVFDTKGALNESERKGKSLILDMFLKSSLVYKSDSPKSIFNCMPIETVRKPPKPSQKVLRNEDSNANMTVSIKVNTHRTVAKSSIYTITKANKYDEIGGKQNKCREIEVQTSDWGNNDCENYSKTKSTKCVQTTLQEHEKITMDEEREFQMNFNFDYFNDSVGNGVPEITLYNILDPKYEKSHTNDPHYTFNFNTPFQTSKFFSDFKKPCTKIKDIKSSDNKKYCRPYCSEERPLSNTKYIEETYNSRNVDNYLKNKRNYLQDAFQRTECTNWIYNNQKRCQVHDRYQRQCQCLESIPKAQPNIQSNMCKRMQPVIEETNRGSCCYKTNNISSKEKYKNLYDNVRNHNYRTRIPFIPNSSRQQCNGICRYDSYDSHENYLKKSNSFPTCRKSCTNYGNPMGINCNIANRNRQDLNKFCKNATRNQKFVQHENCLRRHTMNFDKRNLNKYKSENCLKHSTHQKQKKSVSHGLKFPNTQTKEGFFLGCNNAKKDYGHKLKINSKNTFKKPLDIQYKSNNKKDSSNKQSFQFAENFKSDFVKSQQPEYLFYDKDTVEKSNNITEFTLTYNDTRNHDDFLFEKTVDEIDLNNLETIKSVECNDNNINFGSILSEVGNPFCMSTRNNICQKENKKQHLQFNTEQEGKQTHCKYKPLTMSLKKIRSYPEPYPSPFVTDFPKNTFNKVDSTNDKLFSNEEDIFHVNNNDKEYLKGDRSSDYRSTVSQNCLPNVNVGNNLEFENSKQNSSFEIVFFDDEDILPDNKKCLKSNCNSSKDPGLTCDRNELVSKSEDKLVITLSETEKNLLIKKDLHEEANAHKYAYSDSNSSEEDNKRINDRKMFDLKTGMTVCPNLPTSDFFNFTKRISCIPKGLSPVLNFKTEVYTELSQNSKNALLMQIMQSYEDELKEIKWEKIKTEADVNGVLDELYSAKCKNYEMICPILLPLGINQASAITFSKHIFNEITVIGSVDKKFVVVYAKLKKLLIIIDQHAAHERVRLEMLMNEYTHQEIEEVTFKQSKLKKTIPLKLSSDEVRCLSSKDVNNHFRKLGVSYNLQGNCMDIVAVPTCLYNNVFENVDTEKDKLLKLFVSSFIKEEFDFLKNSRCFSKTIPNFLNKIINHEACRGAIKFGDVLTTEACQNLVQSLSLCKLPFQCAHGRPTMVPLTNMRKMPPKVERQKVNLKKLKAL